MNQKPSPLHRASEWIVDHYRLFFVVFAALLVFSAVASGWVKVENDVAAYLPADSETRQGLDIMEQEFQTYGSAKILLRDTDADAAAATAEQICAVDGVDSCTYTMNDTGSALLSVSLSDLEGSDTCAQTVQALRDLLDGSGAYIYSAEGYSISDQINGEVRGLLVIVAIILVICRGAHPAHHVPRGGAHQQGHELRFRHDLVRVQRRGHPAAAGHVGGLRHHFLQPLQAGA